MINILKILIILAVTDYFLTIFWVWRWNDSPGVRKFKHKIPFKLIEANPLIRSIVENTKNYGLYFGITVGYAIIFLLQLGLYALHWVLGSLVCAFLLGAIFLHWFNNMNTQNEKIIKITKAYNDKLKEKKKK